MRLRHLTILLALAACESVTPPVVQEPIVPGAPVRVDIHQDIVRLAPGDSVRLLARVVDSLGQTVPGVPLSFTNWGSSVATVNDSGSVRAMTPGWAEVVGWNGTMQDRAYVMVSMPFESVIAGAQHACGITAQHDLYCWGADNKYSPGNLKERASMPTPTLQASNVANYTAGYYHGCLTTTSSVTYCWGRDYEGERGDGPAIGLPFQPLQISEPLLSLSAMDWTTCGVTESQRVLCWGENISGELGTGQESTIEAGCSGQPCRTAPFEVPGVRLTSVSSGVSHTCGLDAQGSAYCWGDNDFGQLGVDSVGGIIKPSPVKTTVRFKSIAAGYNRTCAIALDETVYCWGGTRKITTPSRVSTSLKFTDLSVQQTACGIAAQQLYCWPVGEEPALFSDVRFKSVSVGWSISCAVSIQSVVYCWGGTMPGTGFDARNYPIMIAPPGPLPVFNQ